MKQIITQYENEIASLSIRHTQVVRHRKALKRDEEVIEHRLAELETGLQVARQAQAAQAKKAPDGVPANDCDKVS